MSAILEKLMFTGIISHTIDVRVTKADTNGTLLTFDRPQDWNDLQEGESVNTNGVCLTVAAVRDNEYDCYVVPETLERTSFGLQMPEKVNVERALQLNDRLDGHLVQGHVDDTGHVDSVDDSDGRRLTIAFQPTNRNLVVYKGSITIDGVSLTVSAVKDASFEVAIIPYTLEHTTLGNLQRGDTVNLEFDIIGKYVANNLPRRV